MARRRWRRRIAAIHCLLCNLLGLAQNAKNIQSHDFADVRVGVAHVDESFDQDGILGNIFHAGGRHAGNAVEVRAEADVIRAGEFGDVIDVLEENFVIDFRHFREVLLLDGADLFPVDGLLFGHQFDLLIAGLAVAEVDVVGGFVQVAGVEIDADDAARFAMALMTLSGMLRTMGAMALTEE